MTHRRPFNKWLIALGVLMLIGSLAAALPAAAASTSSTQTQCLTHKRIPAWNNQAQVAAQGFFAEVNGAVASLEFEKEAADHYLELEVDQTPSADPVGARITEVDNHFAPAERVKCWQPSANRSVVAEFSLRYDQPAAPFGLTETAMLWNAPFGENPLPMTAFGVTRSLDIFTQQPQYSAIVAQNLVLDPFSGLLLTAPMPDWLDATRWHTVWVTLTEGSVLIEVAQDGNHTVVLATPLLEAPEPVAMEFSVDNELLPGLQSPVIIPDAMEVNFLDVRLAH